jgi:hypothetical protein
VEKTKQKYNLPKLANCTSTIRSFKLGMSKQAHKIFSFVVNFLGVYR